MEPDATFSKSPDIVARGLAEGEGAVLLRLVDGGYFSLNPVALAIWELIDGKRSARDLSAALRDQVVDGPPRLEAEVTAFLERALERGLIVPTT